MAELTGPQLLELEERQLHYFLTQLRPVGEQKSELYPEPKYFYTGHLVSVLVFPEMLRVLREHGGVPGLAGRMRQVLSQCTALHLSAIPFTGTWGREMWLLHEGGGPDGLVAEAAGLRLDDDEVVDYLRFAYDLGCAYREDGQAYASPTSGLGSDYAILEPAAAREIADGCVGVAGDRAREITSLWAAIRALSFLMEAETRDALMMHGPYPCGDGRSLVVYECNDLRWRMFRDFDVSGQRWELPSPEFPYPNLALALVLEDVEIEADRFGTLYVSPWGPDRVAAASLLHRGEWCSGELVQVDVEEAGDLGDACDEIQQHMFLQVATWDVRQRHAAGHWQKMMLMVRILAGAGVGEDRLRETFAWYEQVTTAVWDRFLDEILAADDASLPFYERLWHFIGGERQSLFTPLYAKPKEDR